MAHHALQARAGLLTLIPGTQYGSNDGGLYFEQKAGSLYYVKFYRNADQAKIELLAGKLFKLLFIPTPSCDYEVINGSSVLVTKWIAGLECLSEKDFLNLTEEQAVQIARMFYGAVLTKNHDIAGLNFENILRCKCTGKFFSVDGGGSFCFRARGGSKEYTPDIEEFTSLRAGSTASAYAFNSTFAKHPYAHKEGLRAVQEINDSATRRLFAGSGLDKWQTLYATFLERKRLLLGGCK